MNPEIVQHRQCRQPAQPPTHHTPAHHRSSHCCPPHRPAWTAHPSCLLREEKVHGNCSIVFPPRSIPELVVFRKRYKCSQAEDCQPCTKECPYVRSVQYTVEPVWEQLILDNDECARSVIEALRTAGCKELPSHSDLAQVLQCTFDKCLLVPRPNVPCEDAEEAPLSDDPPAS